MDLETVSSAGQQTPGIFLLPPLPALGLQVYSSAFILYIGAGDQIQVLSTESLPQLWMFCLFFVCLLASLLLLLLLIHSKTRCFSSPLGYLQ